MVEKEPIYFIKISYKTDCLKCEYWDWCKGEKTTKEILNMIKGKRRIDKESNGIKRLKMILGREL
mgnify:CR=1 FL=1